MFTVGLKDYQIWTFIGMYPEEMKIPNKLTFNIQLHSESKNEIPFIDYTLLIGIIRNVTQIPHATLEEILVKIKVQIEENFSVPHFQIRIDKHAPPTGDQIMSSFVEWKQ